MGRSGGRSSSPAPARRSSSSSARSAPAPARSAPPPPAARAQAPPPAQSAPAGGGGMMSGLGATMAQGMAFGTGSAIARQAVGGVMGMFGGGGSTEQAPQQAAPVAPPMQSSEAQGACKMDHQQLMECLNSGSNANNCDFYFTALQQCQANGTV
mmetsp:Transcript_24487/g.23515  ORF Transcript_24487/g.23515 Transcript_24487/m.23515 type:complete len:154 (+) Transcript_24487:118-579(+)